MSTTFCSNCGNKMVGAVEPNFCPKCGQNLKSLVASKAPEPYKRPAPRRFDDDVEDEEQPSCGIDLDNLNPESFKIEVEGYKKPPTFTLGDIFAGKVDPDSLGTTRTRAPDKSLPKTKDRKKMEEALRTEAQTRHIEIGAPEGAD